MRIIYILFLSIIAGSGWSQVTAPFPPIIEKLSRIPVPVNSLPIIHDIFFTDLPQPFDKSGPIFLKSSTNVLALIVGTGRIYALDTTNHIPSWKRVDSTYYSGYNINSLNFFTKGTIFSYGGYGLWNNNGHLRYYAPEKFEWEVKPLNREIPHIFNPDDLYWLDTLSMKLYMSGTNFLNDALKENSAEEKEIGHKTWRLDIKSGDWELLGDSPDTSFRILCSSPWGMLTYKSVVPDIADFENNQYLHATPEGIRKFSRFCSGSRRINLAFFVDSTLYFGNYQHFIDSISFSRADFYASGKTIYTPVKPPVPVNTWLWLGIPLLISGSLFFVLKRRRRSQQTQKEDIKNTYPPDKTEAGYPAIPIDKDETDTAAGLDERDKTLLQALSKAELTGKSVDTEMLNSLLGVSNKSSEIQKKQRSDAIAAINKKMAGLMGSHLPLVIRLRSNPDKRSYIYQLNPELRETLHTWMDQNRNSR